MLYIPRNMPIFYNNFKWSITFKNCESLCCMPVTYNMVHQLYFNFLKSKYSVYDDN